MVPVRETPLSSLLSCALRMNSSAMIKNSGDVMSPCKTPHLMGKTSGVVFLPFVSCIFVKADAYDTSK